MSADTGLGWPDPGEESVTPLGWPIASEGTMPQTPPVVVAEPNDDLPMAAALREDLAAVSRETAALRQDDAAVSRETMTPASVIDPAVSRETRGSDEVVATATGPAGSCWTNCAVCRTRACAAAR